MAPLDRYGFDLCVGSQILFGNENWHFLRIGMENGSPLVLVVGQLVIVLLFVWTVLLEAVVLHVEQGVVLLIVANGC